MNNLQTSLEVEPLLRAQFETQNPLPRRLATRIVRLLRHLCRGDSSFGQSDAAMGVHHRT